MKRWLIALFVVFAAFTPAGAWRHGSGYIQVTLNPDGSCNVCPPGTTKSAAETFFRVNASFSGYSFVGVSGNLRIGVPGVVINNSRFDLCSYVAPTNTPFFTTVNTGTWYRLTNIYFDGCNSTVTVHTICSGQALEVSNSTFVRIPNDWCNPSPLTDRANSATINGTNCSLGYGIAVESRPGLDFFCTTPGTTASSEPASYATAVNGQVITDGTAQFTASNTKHVFANNNVQTSATLNGFHADGMQIVEWRRGAVLDVYGGTLDVSNVVGPGSVTAPINFGGTAAFCNPTCTWAGSGHSVHDITLLAGAQFNMYWGGAGNIVTGDMTYTNIEVDVVGFGALYDGQAIGDNLTMNNIRNYQTSATVSFNWNNNGVIIPNVTHIP